MEFINQYLTYDEYIELGGTLDNETPFNILETEARNELNNYTHNRLKHLNNQPNEVKLCMLALINDLETFHNVKKCNKNIVSESIDGYSVNYGQTSKEQIDTQVAEIKNIIEGYLGSLIMPDGTPYLYMGV